MKYLNLFLSSINRATIFWMCFSVAICFSSDIINKSGQVFVTTAKVKDVHDGDTITVSVTKEFKIRLLDCWAAELKAEDKDERDKAEKAREFLTKMLNKDDEVYIEIPFYDSIEKSFTFGRLLAYVWKDIDGDGQKDNISDVMVKNNLATKNKNK